MVPAVCLCNYNFQQYLEFTVNIDITSYQDGERCTHNPEGRAVPQVVWDYFQVRRVWGMLG